MIQSKSVLLSILILMSMLAGCIGDSEQSDNTELDEKNAQIELLLALLEDANNTIEDLEVQLNETNETIISLCASLAENQIYYCYNVPPVSSISVQPFGTIRVGDSVQFNANGSSDPNGDNLSFSWEFGDNNTATGETVNHTYNSAGTYSVQLCVSDEEFEICDEYNLLILEGINDLIDAKITNYKDNDCNGFLPPSGTYSIVWICENDKNVSNSVIFSTTTIQLDASESSAGNSSTYLTEYRWDLNIYVDSDGDGNPSNDIDMNGENVTWENVSPGEYNIQLTIVDNNGFINMADTLVYVNYRGEWHDFELDRKDGSSGNDNLTVDFPLVYNVENRNTIRYVKLKLTYPIEDKDFLMCWNDICHNRFDMFVQNSTGEDVANTSSVSDEQMTYGDDCDTENNRCLWLTLTSSQWRDYLDGEYTMKLQNQKTHDADLVELAIELIYK